MSYQKKSCSAKALHQLQKCLAQIEEMKKEGCDDEAVGNSTALLRIEIERLKVEVEKENKTEE